MSKGFASDTGSSHRWLAGLLGRSVGSLPSAVITRLRRYYEPVRPCASHRYSAPRGSAPWRSPFASRRQVPTFRTRASRWSHAVVMPVAARPVGRLPPSFGAGQQREPGFGDVPTLSTRQQRFTRVRLTSAHLTGLIPPFAATLTTSAIGPTRLAVVWTLILQSEPEGPTLISCAARLPGVARYISHLLAPSWRTVIRISTDDDLSCCRPPSPPVNPEIDSVMEEDVCKDRADPRSLRGPDFHRLPSAALEEAGLEPPLNQAEDPAVGDPVCQHPHQPSVVDGIKEGADVDVEHPVHALRHQGFIQGSQSRMRAALRPKAVAEPHEVGLVDGIQHLGHRTLDDLVLQSRNAKRAPAAICFRDVRAAHRFGPILSAVDAVVQAPEVGLQLPRIVIHRHPIHPRTGRSSLSPECPFERGNIDVMQQCREPCLTRTPGRLIHPLEVQQQGLPALCPALRLLRRDPVLPPPCLHHLVSFGDFRDSMGRSDSHP